MREIFSVNVSTTLVRQVIGIFINLCLAILIARLLGPAGNGAYALAILFPTLGATLLNLGIAPANVYFLGRKDVDLAVAYKTNIFLWLSLTLFGTFLLAVILFFWGTTLFPNIPQPILWCALGIFPAILLQSLLTSLLQGIQEFKSLNIVLLAGPLLALIGVIFFVWIFKFGILGCLISFALGQLFTTFLTVQFIKTKKRQSNYSWIPQEYKRKCLSYGWKAHLGNILAFINYRADIYLVNLFLTPAATGVYIIAVQLAERLWILSQSISTVLLPHLAELHNNEPARRRITPLVARWSGYLTFIGALLLAGVGSLLITFFFGEEYSNAYYALLWLLPGIILGAISRILSNDIAARGKPEINAYIGAIVMITNISFNILLLPRYGINGAAIATTIAYTLNFIIKLYTYRKLTGHNRWKPLQNIQDDMLIFKKTLINFRN